MKNKLILFLCGLLMAGSLTACGQGEGGSSEAQETTVSTEVASSSETAEEQMEAPQFAIGKINASVTPDGLGTLTENRNTSGSNTDKGAGEVVFEDAAYVMIYNPLIYDENAWDPTQTSQNTGYLGGQILTGVNRAGELDQEDEVQLYTLGQNVLPVLELAEDAPEIKADGLAPIYKKGEVHEFYYNKPGFREAGNFTCEYVGEYCYVWSVNGSVSADVAAENGKAFDEDIYEQVVEKYGTGRFTDNGGKVNILMYPMDGSTMGFFWSAELYADGEISKAEIEKYKVNTNHAIIHVASNVGLESQMTTLAHEFQHLIAFSDAYFADRGRNMMNSWINESMSANAEALIYDDVLDAVSHRTYTYYTSDSFKRGQSLYNFSVVPGDIGAYGTVALFQSYIEELGGNDVFAKFHRNWRNDTSADKTVAKELRKVMPDSVVKSIADKYAYTDAQRKAIGDEDAVWMSKLALDFYIENIIGTTGRLDVYADQLTYQGTRISAEEWMKLFRGAMIYDEINGLNIEGGGSVLVATKNGNFAIPNDADQGLIYVAFDKNFNLIGTSLGESAGSSQAVDKVPGADDFEWNYNKDIYVIASQKENGNCKENILTGTQKALFQAGMENVIRVGEVSDVAAQVDIAIKDKNPGILIVQYDPNNQDTKLEQKLAEAYAAGICVYTFGYGVVDEPTMTWSVHVDMTNALIDHSLTIDTNHGYDDVFIKMGQDLANYVIDSILGPKNHYSVYFLE